MEVIVFLIVFVLILNLYGRVKKLEHSSARSTSQYTSEQTSPSVQRQVATQPSSTSSQLIDYIGQQLKRGVGKEEIINALLGAGWRLADVERAFGGDTTAPVTAPVKTELPLTEKFSQWLQEDWLLKLGALLLLMGFGWFVTYAFLNNWIGPMGRITLGVVVGVLIMLFGFWRIKSYLTQGGVFLVLGSTTTLLTVFAARAVYGFFTPLSALIIMFLSTAFVALASVKYNSRSLSLLSLVLAYIAPLLTNAPETDHVGLFAYLFVVTLGAIWIVALTGQKALTLASLIIISFYSSPHLLSPALFPLVDIQKLLLFAYAFAALFFLTNTASILKSRQQDIGPDLLAAAGNGLLLLAWIMVAVQDEWKSLIISAWMIVFSVGAFLLFRLTHRREPLFTYAGVGIAMLAAATSAELHGASLTIAYTIESGIVSILAYSLLRDAAIAKRFSLLLLGPVMLSLSSMFSRAWDVAVFHADFFVLLVLGLIFFVLGAFFLLRAKVVEEVLFVFGSIYMYILLWLSLHAALFNDNTAVMIALVVYTIIGIISYVSGLRTMGNGLRRYGGVLIGFVVCRLLFIDVWEMELVGRTITFFLIGALLMSTAFLGRKNTKVSSEEGAVRPEVIDQSQTRL